MRPASSVAAVLLALVALAHPGHALFRIDVTAGRWTVPMWMSLVAFVFTGVLAILLWRERRDL